jgi:hypothetical protein
MISNSNSRVYTAIINNNGVFIKYRKISNLKRFHLFVLSKYPTFKFYTIYDKKTSQKIDFILNK